MTGSLLSSHYLFAHQVANLDRTVNRLRETVDPSVGCHYLASANINTIGGYYSTIAGVMAGFAFFALYYLVAGDSEYKQTDHYHGATEALGAAFICLLLVAVMYAILSGEQVSAGRAVTVEMFAGVAFAVAALELIYAIVLLIAAHDHTLHVGTFLQFVGGWLLCPLIFSLIELGVTDYVEVRPGDASNLTQGIGWGLLLALVLGIWIAWQGRQRNDTLWWQMNPSYCAIAVGVAAVAGTAYANVHLEVCDAAAPGLIIATQVIACVALVNQASWLFAPSRRASPDTPEGAEDTGGC
jgi:hypothetical protein